MKHISLEHQAAETIKQLMPNFTPKLGIILGSGLSKFADQMLSNQSPHQIISYQQLPGFPQCTIPGHLGQMTLGFLHNIPVVCLQGRSHHYEGKEATAFKIYIRTLQLLGCDHLLITNAGGSLHPQIPAGELMLINDHINFTFHNPLVGSNDEQFGPRFVAMDDAYDPEIRGKLLQAARDVGINLTQGIYLGTLGPNFETPAEIRAFRTLGADAVGMSTIPEVLIARHCGLKVGAITVITNLAAGLSNEKLSHENTLYFASIASENLSKLLNRYLGNLTNGNR